MSDQRWVDVSHEALIRGWPRLRRWIEENRSGLRVLRRLTEAALEWDKAGRDHDSLYRGARLVQAIEWRQGNEAALNDLERPSSTPAPRWSATRSRPASASAAASSAGCRSH
jgi:hypothetical protein